MSASFRRAGNCRVSTHKNNLLVNMQVAVAGVRSGGERLSRALTTLADCNGD